jgi:hypothetical protein
MLADHRLEEDTMRKSAIAFAAIALLATAGSVAYATIPDSSGAIHACYRVKDGDLRVIDTAAGDACNHHEQPLTWNQTGPQGPAGPAGPQGQAGVSGYQVVAGPVIRVQRGDGGPVVAHCPDGKHVLGGGFFSNGHTYALIDQPAQDGSAWTAFLSNTDPFEPGVTVPIQAWAICATTS